MTFEERFPVGTVFYHCERKCVVMRYIDKGEALHLMTVIGMAYEYADHNGQIRHGQLAECEYPAIEAQNPDPKLREWRYSRGPFGPNELWMGG